MRRLCELKCLKQCSEESYSIEDTIYNCPKCGSLLDVSHRISNINYFCAAYNLKNKNKNHLRENFRNSGVWRYKELVLPDILSDNIITTHEGNNPLIRTNRLSDLFGIKNLYVKLCGNNYTGSFKDLGMTVLVSSVKQAIKNGKKIKAIGCASTGDTSASLSLYAAIAGIPSIILLPRNKVSKAQLIQPIATGSKVFAVDTDFDGCMKLIQKLANDDHIYLANSKNCLRIEGQKSIAFEIYDSLQGVVPDWIVLPSGNLGNSYALYKGFKMLKDLGCTDKMPRLLLAQSASANPLYQSYKNKSDLKPIKAKKTLATAIQIGDPVSADRAAIALQETNGIVEQSTDQELSDIASQVDQCGFYTCPHTAVGFASLKKNLNTHIKPDDTVVVISTANALKFTEFKLNYHNRSLRGIDSKHANNIVEIDNNYKKILNQIS